jgi:hypothetical protein
MASWNAVKDFLKKNYTNVQDNDTSVSFTVGWNDGRSQLVIALVQTNNAGEEWLSLNSPVGAISTAKLNAALESIGEYICGGLVKIGEKHFVRHAAPMADLSEQELLAPLNNITTTADEIEKEFVGGDVN